MAADSMLPRPGLTVAVIWDYFQRYHFARLAALERAGVDRGVAVVGLAAGLGGARRDAHAAEGDPESAVPIGFLGGENEHLNSEQVAAALVAWMERHRPRAVLIPGYGTRASRAALRACHRLGARAVVMFETQERDLPRVWWRELIKRHLLRRADAVFCGGISHAAYAERLGVPRSRIVDGYDVVDNRFWATEAAQGRATRPAGSPPTVLGVGRFVAKKNFPGLVREFAAFAASSGQKAQLTLVGDGPERAAIEAAIASTGIGSRVRLAGYLGSAAIAREMGRADVFVMPSSHEEQWGLVVNEAMAAGLPVIVSEICGCVPDLVEPGVTGLLFDPRRPGALADALGVWASAADGGASLATRARERIARYSPDFFAAQAFRAIELAGGMEREARA